MIDLIIRLVDILANAIVLLVIVSVFLSYVMSPYHPVRRAIEQIVGPLLTPIRRVVPLVGMFDLSPLILIILVEVLSYALRNFLFSLR